MLGKGRLDPGEGVCLERLRQIDPEGLGSQRCAEVAKLRRRCHGRSSTVDGELQPHQAHTAWPMTRCLSRSRSEEHTSELQSLAYLVCRLLLEKKKKYKT